MSDGPAGEVRLLVVLPSLCAEGTPVLVLDLCRRWRAVGISPVVVTLASQPNDLEPEFRAAGIAIERMKLPPSGLGRFPSLAFGTWDLCRRLRPHAVLSMPLGWHSFMFLGARAAGVQRMAAHVGNYPPITEGRAHAKFRFLVQLGRGLTDRLICCSRYIQEGVTQHFGVPVEESVVVYNGVDVDEMVRRASASGLRPSPFERRSSDPFVVGMVARLEMHKDQPTLIRAAALLREAGRPVEVWLIGEGSRRAEYQRLIEELGLGGVVQILGMRRDVPELLGRMDAFAFAAKPDEGLGVALIEAMASGVPIVATDVGACREVLLDGALGDLVPAGDPAAMAAAIARLAATERPDADRIARARAHARSTFSIDAMATAYASILGLS